VAAAAVLTAAPRAGADEDLETMLETPVVTTASRTAETTSQAPATATVISAEDLRIYGIRTLDEALNFLAMGFFVGVPLGGGGDSGTRGVLISGDYGDHVLVLLDGHVLNEPWAGTTYFDRGAAIPIEIVDHIEVMLGPSSVMYGSNAMLGVVNVVTKRAKDYSGLHLIGELGVAAPQTSRGSLRALGDRGYGSALGENYRGAAGYGRSFRLFGKPAEVVGQVELYYGAGPNARFRLEHYGADWVTGEDANFGPKVARGYWGGESTDTPRVQVPMGFARLVVGDFELFVRTALWKRSYPTASYGDFDTPESYERDRWLNLDLRHHLALGAGTDLSSRVFGDVYDYRQQLHQSAADQCLPGQVAGCMYKYDGYSTTAGIEAQLQQDWTRDGGSVTLVGLDARVRQLGVTTIATDFATGADSEAYGEYDELEYAGSAYAQHTQRLTPWLGLNLGVRLDLDQRFGAQGSPRAAAMLHPWDGGTVKLIYADAFRAPTAYEVYFVDPTWSVASPDLKPESVRGVEAGFEQRFGAHRLYFGVFRTWWRNLIALRSLDANELAAAIARGDLFDDVTDAVTLDNVARIDSYGYNGAIDGTFARRLHYGVSLTAAHTRQTDPGLGTAPLPLSASPQWFGNGRVAYDFGVRLPTLALAGRVAGQRPSTSLLDGGFAQPNYSSRLFELKATVSGPVPGAPVAYRVSSTWSPRGRTPYVVGPLDYATVDMPRAQYEMQARWWAFVGLEAVLR
jgi:outer membrane receptor for ferrienterochelin and colicins